MLEIPTTFAALCGVAVLLGARHGLDADHLATVDALARINSDTRPRLARAAGLWFAAGHGVVVLCVAACVATVAARWKAPDWFGVTGEVLSAVMLVVLALLNLRGVGCRATVARPGGPGARLVGRIDAVRHPAGIAAVGALFAISFDTLSLAALFAVTAGRFGGLVSALALGALFALGMLALDGLNGWWVARLVRRAGPARSPGSRLLTLAVSALGLAVGLMALARLAVPAVDRWTDGYALHVSGALFAAIVLAAWLGSRAGRRFETPASGLAD